MAMQETRRGIALTKRYSCRMRYAMRGGGAGMVGGTIWWILWHGFDGWVPLRSKIFGQRLPWRTGMEREGSIVFGKGIRMVVGTCM